MSAPPTTSSSSDEGSMDILKTNAENISTLASHLCTDEKGKGTEYEFHGAHICLHIYGIAF